MDHRHNSNNGYTWNTSVDHNIFNNGDIKMIIDEERGTVFGTLDEREQMLEKVKEIYLKKEIRKICYRIEELMQQIKQQEEDNV